MYHLPKSLDLAFIFQAFGPSELSEACKVEASGQAIAELEISCGYFSGAGSVGQRNQVTSFHSVT